MRLGLGCAETDEDRELLYAAVTASMVAKSELDRAVVLAFDEVYQKNGSLNKKLSYMYVPNHYAYNVCGRHPKEFLFGASVHPYRPDALEQLEMVKENGAVLVKLLPNSHGFDPGDKDLVPYYQTLVRLKLPLLLHTGYEHTIPVLKQSFGDPQRYRLLLDEGVTLIAAHAGSAGRFHLKETFGSFLKLTASYGNCFGDTSALANYWRTKYLKELLNPELLKKKYNVELERPFDKLIHGSDFPIPVTPFFVGRKEAKAAKEAVRNNPNPLALDIAIKRAIGVPDSCLTRAYELLKIGQCNLL